MILDFYFSVAVNTYSCKEAEYKKLQQEDIEKLGITGKDTYRHQIKLYNGKENVTYNINISIAEKEEINELLSQNLIDAVHDVHHALDVLLHVQ